MVGTIPYLMLCCDVLLISIEQRQYWHIYMYWLCLQVDASNSYFYIYTWQLGFNAWIWTSCRGLCKCKMHTRICLVCELVCEFYTSFSSGNGSNWHMETMMLRSSPEWRTGHRLQYRKGVWKDIWHSDSDLLVWMWFYGFDNCNNDVFLLFVMVWKFSFYVDVFQQWLPYFWWVWGFPLIWCKEALKRRAFVTFWCFSAELNGEDDFGDDLYLLAEFTVIRWHVTLERNSFKCFWSLPTAQDVLEIVSNAFGQSDRIWMPGFLALKGEEDIARWKTYDNFTLLCVVSGKRNREIIQLFDLFRGLVFAVILDSCLHLVCGVLIQGSLAQGSSKYLFDTFILTQCLLLHNYCKRTAYCQLGPSFPHYYRHFQTVRAFVRVRLGLKKKKTFLFSGLWQMWQAP